MSLPAEFAVFDLETTGLSSDTDRILQMAVIRLDQSARVTDEWTTYVRPPRVLTADLGPTHIHRIRRRDLLLAPSEFTALARFAELTRGRFVVAHNARFDVGFVRRAAQRHGVELDWAGAVCTLDLSRRLDPERALLHRLADVCERHGVTLDGAHHALNDARATAEVLPRLLSAHGVATAQPPGGRSLQDVLLA